MPVFRSTSATSTHVSACPRAYAICSSENRCFMVKSSRFSDPGFTRFLTLSMVQVSGRRSIAEWLPFPSDDLHFTETPGSQPITKRPGGRRFTFLYPEKAQVSTLAKWRGNQFIILADIKGEKKIPISLTGQTASVPYLVAQCMRVWKTGGSQIGYAPDSDLSPYPPFSRTYCVE